MYLNHISHYVPNTVIKNEYFEKLNGLTDKWITERTGIRERRKAAKGENSSTMGVEAVKKDLDSLPYPVQAIDLIVGATYSPHDTIVTLGHSVQYALGVNHIPVVTISSACSSLLNAVEIVEGYFAMGKASKALVVASEHNTAYYHPADKMSGHLWGDGAAALFISKDLCTEHDTAILDLMTSGAALTGKGTEAVTLTPLHDKICMPYGRDIFINASYYMGKTGKDILQKNGYTLSQLRFFIPHQANKRISTKLAQDLGLKAEQLVSNIEYLGNTGCAGAGIALSECKDELRKADLAVITVFGGGYSYGAMLIKK